MSVLISAAVPVEHILLRVQLYFWSANWVNVYCLSFTDVTDIAVMLTRLVDGTSVSKRLPS